MLVEVGLQAIERPGAERQAERFRVGHRGGEDLGDLLWWVGGGSPRARLVEQPGGSLGVEALDPGVYGGTGDAEFPGDRRRARTLSRGHDDAGPLDGAGLGSPRVGERLDRLTFLGCQLTK